MDSAGQPQRRPGNQDSTKKNKLYSLYKSFVIPLTGQIVSLIVWQAVRRIVLPRLQSEKDNNIHPQQ